MVATKLLKKSVHLEGSKGLLCRKKKKDPNHCIPCTINPPNWVARLINNKDGCERIENRQSHCFQKLHVAIWTIKRQILLLRKASLSSAQLIEGDATNSRVITSNENAWESLTRVYPEAKASELEVSYSKSGKIFGQGQKTYLLYSEEWDEKRQRLNPLLLKQIKTSLGPEREVLIARKDNEIEELQARCRSCFVFHLTLVVSSPKLQLKSC